MLEFAAGLVIAALIVALNGWIAGKVLAAVTRCREPAFTAFCMTLVAVLSRAPQDDGTALTRLLGYAIGAVAALTLLWRLTVRPERARLDAEEDRIASGAA